MEIKKKTRTQFNNPNQETPFLLSCINPEQQKTYSDSIYEVQQSKILFPINCPPVPDGKWYPISVLKSERLLL